MAHQLSLYENSSNIYKYCIFVQFFSRMNESIGQNMKITNDPQLQQAAIEVSERLQAIQDYCGVKKSELARVRFPRGFIRAAASHRRILPSGLSPLLRHNISYSLMTLDVFRWLIIRTDIAGPARSMVIKRAIATLAELMETLVKHYAAKKQFDRAVDVLERLEVLSEDLSKNLKDVWKMRATIHLWEAKQLEHNQFRASDYNKVLAIYDNLRDSLVQAYGLQL